jgi:lipopolysaccharide transport system permease protein
MITGPPNQRKSFEQACRRELSTETAEPFRYGTIFTFMTPEPTIVIEPGRGLLHLELKTIWAYRELLYFLVWRDIQVRYKQTVIGIGWALVQPLVTMLVFTVVFSKFAKIDSEGIPYPVFAYSGLLPWNYFAGSLGRSINSVAGNTYLISKVYFPRLFLPFAGTVSGMIDVAASFMFLIALMIWYGISPTWGIMLLPVFLLLAMMTALAIGLWLSALNVTYRDVGHMVPFLTQIWMFASPIAYPVSAVPEKWRLFYGLNPMVSVIEGFRWALLGKAAPDFTMMALSATGVIACLVLGVMFFKRMERTFADVM